MNRNNYEVKKKAVFDFLLKNKDREGKSLFDRWFEKHVPAVPVPAESSEETGEIKNRMKRVIDSRIAADQRHKPTTYMLKNSGRTFYYKVRIAASFLLVIGVGVSLYLVKKQDFQKQEQVAMIEKKTLPGERAVITLSDGTKVYMNAGSVLRFPEKFTGQTREVKLTGEAFFKVRHMDTFPFIVYSEGLTTTVLGTSFNINAYPEENTTQVAVATGKVRVQIDRKYLAPGEGDSQLFLIPSQMVKLNLEKLQFTSGNCNMSDITGWKDGILVLDNLSLQEVAKKLEKWFGLPVKFEGDDFSGSHFAGRFKKPELPDVLDAISFATGVDYTINKDSVVFDRKK